MTLSDQQLERYARHIVLKEVGGSGQQKLLGSRVLIIGAGGLGSPVALYLAAAGVGTLGVVDGDVVALSNLQRQIIHTTERIGETKTQSAAAAIAALNPDVTVEAHDTRLTAGNALDLIGRYDLVVDGCDNFETRFLINDACYFARRPLVSAAVGRFEGQLATFKAYENGSDGNPMPCYRCLVPAAPPPGTIAPCAEAGILGAVTGVMGSLQAMEVLKELLGLGAGLAGKLLIYEALASSFRIVKLNWDPENPLTGRTPRIHDLSGHR